MIRSYRVPDGVLAELAGGPCRPETLTFLRSTQLSKNLLLTRLVVDALPSGRSATAPAWAVLVQAQRRAPDIIAELLSSPWVGAWATYCLRRMRTVVDPADLSYLDALATVAAIRTGQDADLTLYARDGRVTLPTLGSALIPVADPTPVPVRVRQGRTDLPRAGWWDFRRLYAETDGLAVTLVLDDLDPYRGCYRMPVASRLSNREIHHWQRLFADAWRLLVRQAPGWAAEVAGGLRAMVPLSESDAEPGLSATSRTAFGALALTRPERAEHLAATLVHEFQHSKLSALVDVIPLYDPNTTGVFFAPWRRDARPLPGLLQGAFAFLAVSDVWRRLSDRADARTFAELREQVREVVATLDGSRHLTADGRTLVDGMKTRLAGLLAEPLPPDLVAAARQALADTRAEWEIRNPGAAAQLQ